MHGKMKGKWIWVVPLAVLGLALFLAIGGEVVRLLWNWLLPPLFGWREITFWQALGLLALCRILFGGFGGHGASRPKPHRRPAEPWEHLSPEEKERLRQVLREHSASSGVAGEASS